MIVVHKKNKQQHELTSKQWNDLVKKQMSKHYNVIDNSELVVKEIPLEPEKPKRLPRKQPIKSDNKK